MEKAISSYWFRSMILSYVRKMECSDETAFWMDQIYIIPECRFDTEADTWQGKRHWENILCMRDHKYVGGFRDWNKKVEELSIRRLQEERRKKHEEWEKMSQYINHHYSMMGITIL